MEMGTDTASTKTNLTETSHTGYRVAVVPGAIEVTARVVEPDELRNLIKVLRVGCTILEDTPEEDMDKPLTLTRPAPKVNAASPK
jgi:hypothetical protein